MNEEDCVCDLDVKISQSYLKKYIFHYKYRL